MLEYFKPLWHWTDALQNDFASRADWCVRSYADANHPPVVALAHARDSFWHNGIHPRLLYFLSIRLRRILYHSIAVF